MQKTELLSEIQAMVFALQENATQNETQFLKKVKQRDDTIDLSVLVRIRQKRNIDTNIFLILVKEAEEVSMLELTSLTLNPKDRKTEEGAYSSEQKGHRLKEDEYQILQTNQYDLENIPLIGSGRYALALIAEKGDLNSLIDAYYFMVE